MRPAEALAILAAGAAAGGVNAIVGSGSLITFPTLLAFGFPPVIANVSNNIGLVPGNMSGGFGYRRELAGQRARLVRLGVAAVVGAVAGAIALLVLPSSAFRLVVPVLILISCVLVLVQPWLSTWLRKRADESRRGRVSPLLSAGVALSGVYGGYFGAAQGVLVIGLLGSFLDETMQRVNGAKNVLVGIVNGTAAVVFIALAHVSWMAVALIAAGSTAGGLLGARFGRRLPPLMLRLFVAVIGVISAAKLIFF
ncbi:MAG TPA: sulfite exporter TauE/SafE family protein [Streptosporangiaceae bacterium]|nr:sulfite exporter TauE/SafE family protein [Streptosporangiaceae bacterium]